LTGSRPSAARRLRVGRFALDVAGLEPGLAAEVDDRFGPFLDRSDGPDGDVRVEVVPAGPQVGLGPWSPGESYRIEADAGGGIPRVRSYGFALEPAGERAFALRLVSDFPEPAARRLENALRLLVARLALGAGGLALHGAGVLEGGRAHVLAGPSRAGKSTAVASLGWPSLGDDFAVVLPGDAGWEAAAVPFDNAERVAPGSPVGVWPLAALWRLEKGAAGGSTRLSPSAAAAALAACAAFPWALPDLTEAWLSAALRCAREVPCAVLTFARETDLRRILGGQSPLS
jgi:hypothetical protein